MQRPFNFQRWIDMNRDLLKPPVGNKSLFDQGGMIVEVVGGPNQRVDLHDDPGDEFFYQLRGDMVLKVVEEGVIRDIPIRAGEVFLLPAHVRHSPQRQCRTRSALSSRMSAALAISMASSGFASAAVRSFTASRSPLPTSSRGRLRIG